MLKKHILSGIIFAIPPLLFLIIIFLLTPQQASAMVLNEYGSLMHFLKAYIVASAFMGSIYGYKLLDTSITISFKKFFKVAFLNTLYAFLIASFVTYYLWLFINMYHYFHGYSGMAANITTSTVIIYLTQILFALISYPGLIAWMCGCLSAIILFFIRKHSR